AFNKGALGMLKVTGRDDKLAYSGKQADQVYTGNGADAELMARKQQAEIAAQRLVATAPAGAPETKELQLEHGKKVFMQSCVACHQTDGKGMPGVFPPLAGSDFLKAD